MLQRGSYSTRTFDTRKMLNANPTIGISLLLPLGTHFNHELCIAFVTQ